MHAQDMISTHPQVKGGVNDVLIQCIEDCYACAQTCVACADACLGEPKVEMLTQCIRLNLDCADACGAAGAMASRRTGSNQTVLAAMLRACVEACRVGGEECGRHAEAHEHCRVCADACRRCEESCRAALESVGASLQ